VQINLANIYVSVVQNPFQEMGQPITSVRFRDNVKTVVDRVNTAATNSPGTGASTIRVR
jgi:hypothetical protein